MNRPTPHAPLGAEASFDLGPVGERPALRSGNSHRFVDVYIGCRANSAEPWSLLPFFNSVAGGPAPLPKGRFGRFIALTGDKWMIGPLVFKLCTPIPDTLADDERRACAPVVCGYLEYDNSHSLETAELIFGFGLAAPEIALAGATGFLVEAGFGFVTASSPEVSTRSGDAVFGTALGAAVALHFRVPPQSKRIFPLVLGFHQQGYRYTEFFRDLTAVLHFGLGQHAHSIALADRRDADFMRSAKPFDAKARSAQEVREWLARSRWAAGEPAPDLAALHTLAG